jgi:hypothetical protein
MATELVEDDEGDRIDECADDRCCPDDEDPPKLWRCVDCDRTYCKYDR